MSAAELLPGIDRAGLEPWILANVRDTRSPFDFKAIVGGHSNITYQVIDANGMRFVLRRPPLGNQPHGAHDMSREYRIQSALRITSIPVPPMEALCEDSRIIGAPFYVMRWVDGTVVDSPDVVAAVLPTSASRRTVTDAVLNTLVAIHRLDIDAVHLDNLGMRNDFVARQTERMRRLWEKIRTRDIPLIDSVHARLVRHRPPQRYTGLVHNDYRIGNLILTQSRVSAVLDWELAALGDVLVDIGALVNNWDGSEDSGPDIWMRPAPTRAGGFPTRAEIVENYARQSGFDVCDLDYYRALSYWRIAIIGEGMRRRYESGEMAGSTTTAAVMSQRVQDRVEMAHRLLAA